MNWQEILKEAFGTEWAKVDPKDKETLERVSKRLVAIAAAHPSAIDADERADLTAIVLNIRGKYSVRFRRKFNESLETVAAIALRVALKALIGL